MSIDILQWPAMVITLIAGWLVGSTDRQRRRIGFWLFLVSNILWIVWGTSTHAYALIVLQIGLAITNVRGEMRNTKRA